MKKKIWKKKKFINDEIIFTFYTIYKKIGIA